MTLGLGPTEQDKNGRDDNPEYLWKSKMNVLLTQ
jgi:hypothetical protein